MRKVSLFETGSLQVVALLLTYLLFLLNPVYPQGEELNLSEAVISVIVVISIILILLYLAGLLKLPRGAGNSFPLILFIILITVIFVLPILQRLGIIRIFPDNIDELFERDEFKGFMNYRMPNVICLMLKNLNISESIACYMPAILYFFILPFAAIYAITWAFLKQIKIFEGLGRSLEALIAFIIAFMTLPMGTFMLLISMWFSVLGAFSIAIFVAMFLAGVFFRGFGFIKERHFEYVGKRSREEHIKKVNNAAKWSIDRIQRATDIDEIIRAVEWFMEKTGYFTEYSKIDEIRKKELSEAKSEAEKLIRELASKAS